ncbi:MAG: hypothetical protein ACYS15_18270 [Planctomycetota bacterium]|jgi:hypothetical protein
MVVNWLKLGLFALAVTNAACAQTSRPIAPAATQPADEQWPSGFLAGPRVSDDGDDSNAPFGGRHRGQRAVPAREWFRVLDGLQLGPQQQAEINRIRRELRRATLAYRKARRETEDGQKPQAGGSAVAAPDVHAFQRSIWALLDETQQATMRAELAEVRKRVDRRHAERMGQAPGDAAAPPAESHSAGLDEAGRRRLAFLLARQAQRRVP